MPGMGDEVRPKQSKAVSRDKNHPVHAADSSSPNLRGCSNQFSDKTIYVLSS